MGPARAGLVRDTLGSLAVLGTVALAAFGLPLIDQSLPDSRSVAADVPYSVGGGVSVVPPSNASIDLTKTRPGDDRGTVLFLVGDVRIAIVVMPYQGDLDGATDRLRSKITRTGDGQLGASGSVQTGQDVTGVRGSYTSAGRQGAYAVYVCDGRSVELTATGAEPNLRALAPQLEHSVRSVTFDAGSGP